MEKQSTGSVSQLLTSFLSFIGVLCVLCICWKIDQKLQGERIGAEDTEPRTEPTVQKQCHHIPPKYYEPILDGHRSTAATAINNYKDFITKTKSMNEDGSFAEADFSQISFTNEEVDTLKQKFLMSRTEFHDKVKTIILPKLIKIITDTVRNEDKVEKYLTAFEDCFFKKNPTIYDNFFGDLLKMDAKKITSVLKEGIDSDDIKIEYAKIFDEDCDGTEAVVEDLEQRNMEVRKREYKARTGVNHEEKIEEINKQKSQEEIQIQSDSEHNKD